MTTRAWIGRLDTDHWDHPICDGWPVDLTPYIGKRVELIVRVVGDDPNSYANLARRHAGEESVPLPEIRPTKQDPKGQPGIPDWVKELTTEKTPGPATAPATEGTHSVSRPPTAGTAPILYPSVRDV